MRVDFYQLSRDPVERVTAMLARKVLQAGKRLLVLSADAEQREALSKELWRAGPEEFLANGDAAQPNVERQPILLSETPDAANGASMVLIADGKWRPEALGFERALLLFGPEDTEAARALWRELDGQDEVTREIHKQDDSGKWRAGG
ncbi:DNA polymerase III subunit chi [Altererythrobacter arenosus]|uniref:DNA polymerase III subunit chi n=1 Tax=Altererythrobacter arenosus TaxID=3032592 RepID=A0ABY8FN92_9SPHN|nr:DNA polymerase III subunit chi [Altererythrobacter sp. CAU 1644]WFL76494.1 DNA polymerase III subunit chi [Altererythrobacter sp. CAU 1644]